MRITLWRLACFIIGLENQHSSHFEHIIYIQCWLKLICFTTVVIDEKFWTHSQNISVIKKLKKILSINWVWFYTVPWIVLSPDWLDCRSIYGGFFVCFFILAEIQEQEQKPHSLIRLIAGGMLSPKLFISSMSQISAVLSHGVNIVSADFSSLITPENFRDCKINPLHDSMIKK